MSKLTISLYSVLLRLITSSKQYPGKDTLLTLVDQALKVRYGSRVSRVFRILITAKKMQRIIGGVLAVVVLTTTLFPPSSTAYSAQAPEVITLPVVDSPIATEVVRRYPVDGKVSITQGYRLFHPGVDIDGLTGDSLHPIMNGYVLSEGIEFMLGKTVRIDHGNGYVSVYAHLDTIKVKPGQGVTTRTTLGTMGATGHAFGDHLHLEVYKDGRTVNPLTILPSR